MFCVGCGQLLVVGHKFCSQCGTKRPGTESSSSTTPPSTSLLTFSNFKAKKESDRASFFRPSSKGKKRKRQEEVQEDLKEHVVQRGKALQVSVPKSANEGELRKACLDKHLAHPRNLIHEGREYVLLYPDGTKVETLKESSEDFSLYKYKGECRRQYHRITFFITTLADFVRGSIRQCIRSDEELSNETDLAEVLIVDQLMPRSSEEAVPIVEVQAHSSGLVNIVPLMTENDEKKETISLHTLIEMFPQLTPTMANDALERSNGIIETAVSDILSSRSDVEQSSSRIYASLDFCNNILGDEEFAESMEATTVQIDIGTEMFVQSTPHRPIHHAKRPKGKLFEDIHEHSSIENSDVDILRITDINLLEEPSKLSISIESFNQESDKQALSNISKSQGPIRRKLAQTICNNTNYGDPFQCSDSESCSDQSNCESESTISTRDSDSVIEELNKSEGETTDDEAESYR
eukprot:Seg1482.9 transcript_id=Seg1482.9/GoldUCD/mRNA.D3Y31 product="hypothetical protein" protein_id=Seg1482.9/GoldUCD/D3Y31